MRFLSSTWCDLEWSIWIPFTERKQYRDLIPKRPGVYRIKPVWHDKLAYIGQTSNLKVRMGDLVRETLRTEMPFNDPHTAAPGLWAWHDAEGMEFELSVSPKELERSEREGLECYMLWQYRVEYRESTLCNHGHFHARYTRPTNKSKGVRGRKLREGEVNLAGGLCHPPLIMQGNWADDNWMGLRWSQLSSMQEAHNAPKRPGVYKIICTSSDVLLYIGQGINLRQRLRDHARKDWKTTGAKIAYYEIPENSLPHQLKEVENDLIGGYFGQAGKSPKFQFLNIK